MRIGKITENVLKRSVWKQIHRSGRQSAAVYTDCASFSISEEADKAVEKCQEDGAAVKNRTHLKVMSATGNCPLDIRHSGRYAVVSAVNNILAAGGKPQQILMNILLPMDAEEKRIREIMQDGDFTALSYETEIAGGHTEVTPLVNAPVVSACAAGYGFEDGFLHRTGKKPAGCSLVMTKWAGLSGTAILTEEMEKEIRKKYPSFIADEGLEFGAMKYLSIADEAAIALENGALCMHDLSNGGIFAALWEMGEMTGCGMDIYMKSIPLRQETVEITDMFDVNPYLMHSQGSLLIASPDPDRLCTALDKAGIPASVIGTLNSSNDRKVHNDDEVRFLDLPQSDSLTVFLSSQAARG
jgi:hydrogenase maturation factor